MALRVVRMTLEEIAARPCDPEALEIVRRLLGYDRPRSTQPPLTQGMSTCDESAEAAS